MVEGGTIQTVHGVERLVGTRRTYAIDADAAMGVQKMFDWFVDGGSTISIAVKLNEAGAPSPRGRRWIGSSAAALIDNSMYLGSADLQQVPMGRSVEVRFERRLWRLVGERA